MPLRAVLEAFGQAGPLSLSQLAQRLDVEPNMLDGMIQFWVHKGKLREVGQHNCTACGVLHGCPILVALPRRYEMVTEDPASGSTPCQCQR